MSRVVLQNDRLRVAFLADKGTDLVELVDRKSGVDFAWRAPFPPQERGGFLDTYPGGWQEVLPNGGAPAAYRGVAFDQHGSVATIGWDYTILGEDAARFEVTTPRYPLHVNKTARLNGATLEFTETLTNLAAVPMEAMWGQHITFGEPFLHAGCEIRLPSQAGVIEHPVAIDRLGRRRSGPLSRVPVPGDPSDIVYLTGCDWYEVRDGSAGLRVEWDAQTLPYLWFWQEMGATVDWPWWGKANVIGLEPFSSYPTDGLPAAVANGSALRLEAGETRSLWWKARVIDE